MSLFQPSRFARQTNVFYITSWGHAGDHWLSKVINAHPEIFVLNSHEGSRPKYFKDSLGRHQRPDVLQYTAFLEDMGTDYQAIGECHAYRATQMAPVREKYGDAIPIVNLLRHPYAWLEFYIRHRATNVRMPDGSSDALDHEWEHTDHEYFKSLEVAAYEKKDVEVWSAYQGMLLLNKIVWDVSTGIPQIRIEDILQDRKVFADLIAYLTHGRCHYDDALLGTVYELSRQCYRGEETHVDPQSVYEQWPEWKRQAFRIIVSDEALECYARQGYRYL